MPPPNPRENTFGEHISKARRPLRNPDPNGYFWMHGYQVTMGHSSATCNSPAEGHQRESTRTNVMGGSNRNRLHEWQRQKRFDIINKNKLNLLTLSNIFCPYCITCQKGLNTINKNKTNFLSHHLSVNGTNIGKTRGDKSSSFWTWKTNTIRDKSSIG